MTKTAKEAALFVCTSTMHCPMSGEHEGWHYRVKKGDYFGLRVAVSADGSVVASGARYSKGTDDSFAGKVRAFVWNGTHYSERGASIEGSFFADYMGNEVSLSADGKMMAVSADGYDGDNGMNQDSGTVRVYQYLKNHDSWIQRVRQIDGLVPFACAGPVSLSGDGDVLAFSSKAGDDYNIVQNFCVEEACIVTDSVGLHGS